MQKGLGAGTTGVRHGCGIVAVAVAQDGLVSSEGRLAYGCCVAALHQLRPNAAGLNGGCSHLANAASFLLSLMKPSNDNWKRCGRLSRALGQGKCEGTFRSGFLPVCRLSAFRSRGHPHPRISGRLSSGFWVPT